MKKSSCIIQIITYTLPHSECTTIITYNLLQAINKGYTRINTCQRI